MYLSILVEIKINIFKPSLWWILYIIYGIYIYTKIYTCREIPSSNQTLIVGILYVVMNRVEELEPLRFWGNLQRVKIGIITIVIKTLRVYHE